MEDHTKRPPARNAAVRCGMVDVKIRIASITGTRKKRRMQNEYRMNTELVRAVFDCGIDDLRLLDDAECDMYAVIGRMREEGIELTMNNIIRQVFEEGRYILTKAREEKIASLPAEPLTEADFELRGNLERLNPEQDFSFWINLQDTNFRGKSELQELYESMFTEELEQCENLTGYPIEW